MYSDMHHNTRFLPAISPVVNTDNTARVSAILDMAGYEAAEFVLLTGAITDTGCSWVVLVEEGDASDLADNTAVADADMYGTEAGAQGDQTDDDTVYSIGLRVNGKRYKRVTVTPASVADGNLPLAAVWAVGAARKPPFTAQAET